MIVGVLTLDLVIYEAMSLKDKRRVVKSLKDRISHRFNVSVAEVDRQDARQRAVIGVAMVSNAADHIHGVFDRIVELVNRESRASLVDSDREML